MPNFVLVLGAWHGGWCYRYAANELRERGHVVATPTLPGVGERFHASSDLYRTPHTEKLHMIERWQMTEEGKGLEVVFQVDDPDAFYQPWWGKRRYRRVQEAMLEDVCAENNQHLFDYHMPVSGKLDF